MQTTVRVRISETYKPEFSQQEFRQGGTHYESFDSVSAARTWLHDAYGTCKRVPMYVDTSDNPTQVGYVYCFIGRDGHGLGERWVQQDWVDMAELHPVL